MKFAHTTIVPMNAPSLPTHDKALPLGKESAYPDRYDPTLLYPIARELGRAPLGLTGNRLPFIGWDLWRGYELSWLNGRGMPQTAILKAWVPATSPNIVESKSFKLYLNSLNNERFQAVKELQELITADIERAAGAPVKITLITPENFESEPVSEPNANVVCLDEQDIDIQEYQPNSNLLNLASDQVVTESLFSRLLKSNCPVTGQPDWGSLHIQYRGMAIDHAALLRYIVSFRQHQGFHEQCVEQMFCQIMAHCKPEQLSIYARYTRRGGMDINPWRATPGTPEPSLLRSAQQ